MKPDTHCMLEVASCAERSNKPCFLCVCRPEHLYLCVLHCMRVCVHVLQHPGLACPSQDAEGAQQRLQSPSGTLQQA